MGRGSGYNNRGGFSGGRGNWLASTSTNNGRKVICQLCGKIGHVVHDCYYRFDQSFKGPFQLQGPIHGNLVQFDQSSPYSFGCEDFVVYPMTATTEAVYDETWYPDSEATNHLTADASNLMTKSEFHGPKQVHMGNGQVHTQHSAGGEA